MSIVERLANLERGGQTSPSVSFLQEHPLGLREMGKHVPAQRAISQSVSRRSATDLDAADQDFVRASDWPPR
jgi:hypothetical protein